MLLRGLREGQEAGGKGRDLAWGVGGHGCGRGRGRVGTSG